MRSYVTFCFTLVLPSNVNIPVRLHAPAPTPLSFTLSSLFCPISGWSVRFTRTYWEKLRIDTLYSATALTFYVRALRWMVFRHFFTNPSWSKNILKLKCSDRDQLIQNQLQYHRWWLPLPVISFQVLHVILKGTDSDFQLGYLICRHPKIKAFLM